MAAALFAFCRGAVAVTRGVFRNTFLSAFAAADAATGENEFALGR
jgi:hypothetical protein